MPGGFNEKNPPLSWKEIGEGFHCLAPQRGLGKKSFPSNKIAARYYEHIKPLHEKLDQDLAMNTARNAGNNPPGKRRGKGKGKAKEGASAEGWKGHDFFETLESWEEERGGSNMAAEKSARKGGFFDIMEQMDKEDQASEQKLYTKCPNSRTWVYEGSMSLRSQYGIRYLRVKVPARLKFLHGFGGAEEFSIQYYDTRNKIINCILKVWQ
jgi:hypothetical protein